MRDPDKVGRARAILIYPEVEPCEVCGKISKGRGTIDRHHRDGNRLNNERTNIAFLCRKHHADAHRLLDGHVGGGPRPRVAAMMRDRARAMSIEARRMMDAGAGIDEVAADLGVHKISIYRWFRKYGT